MSALSRIRVVPRTLRGRLIAGLLTLLIGACATVGLVTYLAVRDSLSGGLTNDLQTATGLAYDCFDPNGGPGTAPQPGSADPAGTGQADQDDQPDDEPAADRPGGEQAGQPRPVRLGC